MYRHNGPDRHTETGRWGEEVAAAYLRGKGYIILERDWRSGHRDIDIIARLDNVIVFVEVKTRSYTDFNSPEQAIDYAKKGNLRNAISHYVKARNIDSPYRFDIVTVVGAPGCTEPIVNHMEDVGIIETATWRKRNTRRF